MSSMRHKTGRPRKARIATFYVLPTVWIVALIALWQIAVDVSGTTSPLYPGPGKVLHTFWNDVQSGLLLTDLAWSLVRVATGFTVGAALGLVCGFATANSIAWNRTVGLFIEIIRPIPPVALVPLFVLWFGLGEFAKDSLIVVGVLPVVWISTHIGLKGIPSTYVWTAESLGAQCWKIMTNVSLPAALPVILAGLRSAMGVAFFCLVAAEMAGAFYGLSYRIELSNQYFRVDQILAYLAALGLTFLVTQFCFSKVVRKAFPWAFLNDERHGN